MNRYNWVVGGCVLLSVGTAIAAEQGLAWAYYAPMMMLVAVASIGIVRLWHENVPEDFEDASKLAGRGP